MKFFFLLVVNSLELHYVLDIMVGQAKSWQARELELINFLFSQSLTFPIFQVPTPYRPYPFFEEWSWGVASAVKCEFRGQTKGSPVLCPAPHLNTIPFPFPFPFHNFSLL